VKSIIFDSRTLFAGLAASSVGLVLIAAYVEPFSSLDPCPMCMMQRAIYLLVAVFAVLGLLTYKSFLAQKIFAFLSLASSVSGILVAGRQVWLQHLPEDKVPACGPGLEYMIDVFPLLEVIQMSLMGTGDCAKVQWQWLGLSIPAWSIVAFSTMALICLCILMKKRKA
jgi:protein dithiol:quinone oxidoreductase